MDKEQFLQLEHIISALADDFYHPIGEIPLSGFKADRDLTLAQAARRKRKPIPAGTVWGDPGDYAWMFGEIVIPESAAGERIVMDLNPGGEATVFIDGKPFGTRRAEWVSKPHHYIVDQMICKNARGGEHFDLAMEVYGGTPLPDDQGKPVFPENGVHFVNDRPAAAGRTTFGFWNEEAYQLWLDLDILRDLYKFLDDNDCMKEKITLYLGRMLDTLDAEQPLKARRAAYKQARRLIAPLMKAHNGSFAPSMAVIGNSHLDLAWLWTTDETRRKTARTFAAQLRLLKEYPEALFIQSQCAEYEMCREHYPELYEEIKKAIAGGQWIADGGMWVEPDTNLAGGEALVRQFLYGKAYFREQLGVESRVAWLPDTFGYSAALPQIIRKFNMEGLTTQKIYWSYNDSERFPHHAFRWKGMDGSEIPCYLHMAYETKVDAATLHTRWITRVEKDGSGDFFLPFGYGDGGGGPTRDDMEQIRRQKDLQGSPKLYYMTPGAYLAKRNKDKLPVYRGELYFPCHRGTYTTQAAIKKLNRAAENAMRTWEMLAAYSAFAGKSVYPRDELEQVWKLLLKNQFHDILPGSAIGPVYEKARNELKQIIQTANRGAETALASFRISAEGATLFNPATHAVRRTLDAENGFDTVSVPALGCSPVRESVLPAAVVPATAVKTKDGYLLQNSRLSVQLNGNGEIIRMTTLSDGIERVRGISNRFCLYRDLPRRFDAWDIDSQTFDREEEIKRSCATEIVSAGGGRASVRFTTRLSGSVIDQVISLDADAEQLDFDTRVDWHERHRLLKVRFDTGIEADEARHQIQFGFIDRPAHRSRRYDMDRFEVCNHTYSALFDATHGAAVLNDCKYGISAQDGALSLSLLRAPTYPDAAADQGGHSFKYAYYVWNGPFETSGILSHAEEMNIPLCRAEGICELAPLARFSTDAVTLESVKLAQDGSGDMILRLYENMKGLRNVQITFPFTPSGVWECDLEENPLSDVLPEQNSVTLTFTPFEIKTIRLKKEIVTP